MILKTIPALKTAYLNVLMWLLENYTIKEYSRHEVEVNYWNKLLL